jgi:hypothetical protein
MLNRAAPLRASLAALAAVSVLLAAAGPSVALARQPVVAELYTSQGCSACTAANALTGELDGRPGVLALTFPVDYWDYLGWRDTFAEPAFSERQRAYAKALGLREVYTPQVIVDGLAQTGRSQAGQSLPEAVEALVRKAARTRPAGLQIRVLRRAKVYVGAGRAPSGGGEVWLVRYQTAPAEVTVTEGENRGQTVQYRNVVRQLERLGAWTGKARLYDAPEPPEGGLKTAVLVQARGGGRILAVLAP